MRICKVEGCGKKYKAKGYCCTHYARFSYRKKFSLSLDLSIKYSCKGKRNFMWRGGIAEYPNHYLMKKNRLIILMQNPKCEYCGKPATQVHHKDGSKTNHSLSNLAASCQSCNSTIRFRPNNSKYFRKYGMNLQQIADKIGYSLCHIWRLEQQGILEEIIINKI